MAVENLRLMKKRKIFFEFEKIIRSCTFTSVLFKSYNIKIIIFIETRLQDAIGKIIEFVMLQYTCYKFIETFYYFQDADPKLGTGNNLIPSVVRRSPGQLAGDTQLSSEVARATGRCHSTVVRRSTAQLPGATQLSSDGRQRNWQVPISCRQTVANATGRRHSNKNNYINAFLVVVLEVDSLSGPFPAKSRPTTVWATMVTIT